MGGSVRKRDFIVTPASDHPHYDQVGFSDAFDVLATVSQNEADIERIEFDDRGVRPGGEHRHPPLALNRVLLVIDRVQRREFRKYHSVSLDRKSSAWRPRTALRPDRAMWIHECSTCRIVRDVSRSEAAGTDLVDYTTNEQIAALAEARQRPGREDRAAASEGRAMKTPAVFRLRTSGTHSPARAA
jgi:hypothetical protein